MKVSHVVVFPINLILYYGRDGQGGRSAQSYDHFLVFLAAWAIFPRFLGRLRSDLR